MPDEKLLEIQRAIGRLEGKIDFLIRQSDATNDNHDELEDRVRKVEGGQRLHTGVAIGISSALSFLINAVIKP